MTKLAWAALQVVEVVDVLLPRNRRSYNDMCAPSLLPAPLVAPGKIMCRLSTHAFTLSTRHIVFELFDTDLNHMIRSETCYDMTHRRWVLYQVRLPSLLPTPSLSPSYPAVGLTLSGLQILQGLAHMHSADVFHRDLVRPPACRTAPARMPLGLRRALRRNRATS